MSAAALVRIWLRRWEQSSAKLAGASPDAFFSSSLLTAFWESVRLSEATQWMPTVVPDDIGLARVSASMFLTKSRAAVVRL
ncbi:hypothetical protein [Streptomyces xanthochromogenes]|uniref:hypothetical protein n=1 Tax=Streptomyces xanthochromogenes TaxID=67384 RepID=UPI0037FADB8E